MQGQKTRCALTTPPQCGRNGTASLQITSRKQQTRRVDRPLQSGVFAGLHALDLASYRWALLRISTSFYFTSVFDIS